MKCRTTLVFACVLALLIVTSACKPGQSQTFIDITKKVLYGSQQTWGAFQKEVIRLKNEGKLTPEQWEKFLDLEKKYIATHNAAVTALKEYVDLKDLSKEQLIIKLVTDSFAIIDPVRDLIAAWSKTN